MSINTLFGTKYPDTFQGGQKLRQDVDNGYIILLTKEPEDVSVDCLRGFRNPDGMKDWDFNAKK